MPRPQRQRQRARKQGPRLSFSSLEVTQPTKLDDGWEVKAIATVFFGNRAPDPPREIVFVVDGAEYEKIMTDSETGMATSVMFFRGIGEHVITAFISDFLVERRQRSFFIKEEKEKSPEEKELASVRAKTELARAKKELKEATPPQGKCSLKIVKAFQQLLTLEVFLRRIGTDGKPEAGEVSAWYFDRYLGKTVILGPQTSTLEIPVVFSVSDFVSKFDEIVFYLPDHSEVEKVFRVPARTIKEEVKPETKRPARIPLSQRLREAYVLARDRGSRITEIEGDEIFY